MFLLILEQRQKHFAQFAARLMETPFDRARGNGHQLRHLLKRFVFFLFPNLQKELSECGHYAVSIKADVSSSREVNEMFERISREYGGIDVLVNNAGITRDGLFVRMKEEDFDLVVAVNLKGTYNFTRAAAPIMMKQRSGRIVSISSIVGIQGNAGQVNYSASKAGIIGLTKSVARELASRGVTCNAIAPGYVETPMTAVLPDKVKEAMLEAIPMKRYGQVEDIANCVGFLASDSASYITGQVISVDGGMHM